MKVSTSEKKMLSYKPFEVAKALVALELGPGDAGILRYFARFIRQVPTASAYFVHVVPPFPRLAVFPEEEGTGAGMTEPYERSREVVNKLKQRIENFVTGKEMIHVNFDVMEGDPLEEVLRTAADIQADLILIGQKAGTDDHGILAKNLARKVSCNALIVPEKAADKISSILVPIDFSPNSIRAFQMTLAINEQLDEPARITVMHVYELPDFSVYKISKTPEQFGRMVRESHEKAMSSLIEAYVPDPMRDKVFTVLQQRDKPNIAHYILDQALEIDADLLVIGAKGHSRVDLLLLGSVTEKVLAANEDLATLVVR